nr:hypothetical protein [Tanacetum cinerariifolium]
TAFLPNRQILDGPFIVNEILSRFNGSPTVEFQFHRGLKQGDPLAPFLFILVMESLHLSFCRAVEAVIFTGIKIDSSLILSHLFYADDAVFIGMSINIHKSHFLGIGVSDVSVSEAANQIGGRLTLLKAVLGSTPIYNMSLFKVPKQVLNSTEQMRMNFFIGLQEGERKIAWVKWSKVLASKKFGELGVSSFFALNRALIFDIVFLASTMVMFMRENVLRMMIPYCRKRSH